MTIHVRALTVAPTTADTTARTVEAIVSTGADVVRGAYVERLPLDAADLSRLVGAPVLDAHRATSTRDQLGVIEAAEIRPEGLWVRIKFRTNDAAAAVLADIAEGTLRGLSIGYTVTGWKDVNERGQRVRIAQRWTPLEVSVVPVPADPGAHFRNGDTGMENEEQTIEATPSTTTASSTQTRAQTNTEIRQMAETAGLSRAWADEQIDAEATVEQARAAAFDAMRQRSAQTPTHTTRATVGTDNTDPAVIATRAGEALFARINPAHQLSDAARPWAGMTMLDLARDCMTRSGIRTAGMAADTVITRALHSTSDFPLILGDTVGRELRGAYTATPAGVRQLARQNTAPDFRAKRALQMGQGAELLPVGEGAEFKHGTIEEAAESYAVSTFGRIFSITRQAIINDDLGAFTQIPAKMGRAAAAFEAAELVKKLEANPAMSDGVTVFHADHGNLAGTGAALDVSTLGGARLSMRKQTGIGGERIDVTPRFVLVPPELETVAEQVLSEIAAAKVEDVNPFQNLTLVTDVRLTDTAAWYVVADPAMIDGLEYAYLEGAPGPQIETRQGFETDGLQMKVRLDFGCGWIDHRGWFKNEGPAG